MRADADGSGRGNGAVWVAALTVASSVGALFYRGVRWAGYGHSAAIFVGLPAVLAILLALTPRAKSLTGGIAKGITLMLLIVAPLLGEGFICILIASPLFYIVGIVVGLAVDWNRRRRGTTICCVALVLLPFSLEGVMPWLTPDRGEIVEVTEVVNAPVEAVERALGESPRLGVALPGFLRIGFPLPLEAHGRGLEVGARRAVRFAAAEGAPAGDLVMEVVARGPGSVRLERVKDATKIGQWMTWEWNEVQWEGDGGGRTRVVWRIGFRRQLDPAWYFVALERAAVHEAARYMIAANATPVEAVR